MRAAIFLDRDGTLNEDPGYLSDPSQLVLIAGVAKALGRLKRAGYELVVVSNQSGVGRGLIAASALDAIHTRLNELLAPDGGTIDAFYCCTHRPEVGCACRKPSPKLLQDAARERGLDLSHSWMVGDKQSDIEAGVRAGLRGQILVLTGHGTSESLPPGLATERCDSLVTAADFVLAAGAQRGD